MIKDTLLNLRAAGTAILFSTHVMEQAEQIEKLQSAIDVLVRLQLSDMKYSDTALP